MNTAEFLGIATAICPDKTAIVFEDNTVGRLKKQLWDASEAEIDKILVDYGIPSEPELGKAGTYVQTTVRQEVVRNRQKNDVVIIPYNNLAAAKSILTAHAAELACVIGEGPDLDLVRAFRAGERTGRRVEVDLRFGYRLGRRDHAHRDRSGGAQRVHRQGHQGSGGDQCRFRRNR